MTFSYNNHELIWQTRAVLRIQKELEKGTIEKVIFPSVLFQISID